MKTLLKSLLLAIMCMLTTWPLSAQVSVNADGSSPDGSAMLDVQSSTKGFLVPRLTSAQKDNISQPATGLLIYQTDGAPGFYYNGGTPSIPSWTALSSSSTSVLWLRSPIDHSTFLANTDDSIGIGKPVPTEKLDIQGNLDIDNFQPMILFREDSLEAARIRHFGPPDIGYLHIQAWDGNNFETTGLVVKSPTQKVGVGTTTPSFKLDVAGTTRTSGFILSSTTQDGYILTSDENGVASWQLPASHLAGSGIPGYLPVFTQSDTLKSSVIFQDSNGNIGISDNQPQFPLDVGGKMNMHGNIILNDHWLSADGTDKGLFVNGAGKVGIGTNTPGSTLTSAGMIQTMAEGIKFPDNTVQTTASRQSFSTEDGAEPRWIIAMKIDGIPGPYTYEGCPECSRVFGLDWYFNNTYDSISGQLTNGHPQHHVLTILKDIDRTSPWLLEILRNQTMIDWIHFNFYYIVEGNPEPPYYTIELSNVRVTKFRHSVVNIGGDKFAHMDKIDFIYSDIECHGDGMGTFSDFWGP
jgi:type VI secretion system Hcp family effector